LLAEESEFEARFDAAVEEIERRKKSAVELLTDAVKLLEQAENKLIEAAQTVDGEETRYSFDRIISIEIRMEDAGIDLTRQIERLM
jgi:hypothetical protein